MPDLILKVLFQSLGVQMKLIKFTSTKGEDGEKNYTHAVEMISDDPNELKSKAHGLCQIMGVKPAPWSSKYSIIGEEINSDHEWIMSLSNGAGFVIEK